MTPDSFLEAIEEPRRSEMRELHELIRGSAPDLEPVMMGKMIGYGKFHYRYETGREGDTAVLTLANNKNYISLYVLCADGDGYLAERYKESLPKADIGKSCVRIKRLDDVDLEVVRDLVTQAASMGGAAAV
jgi:hypothetical protein